MFRPHSGHDLMPFFEIQNFKFGLDTRRSELTSQPGTLEVLQNAHINQGGEIEKRKSFVATGLPANVFGFQETLDGIYVFGSVAAPTLSAPFLYQKLVHPLGLAMTGVVSSTYINDEVFVVTTWSNGDVLCYYDGNLVDDFTSGLQNSVNNTPYKMALDLTTRIAATGLYTVTPPVLSNLWFQVTDGSAGNVTVTYTFLTARVLTAFLTTTTVTFTTVAWNTSNNHTATLLAAAISAMTDGHGNNLGFVGTVDGTLQNKVIIVPPGGVDGGDQVSVVVSGNVTAYVPPYGTSFDVFSIPTESSTKPFTVAQTTVNAALTNQLVSTGVAATGGQNSVAQFTIFGGTSNVSSTATVTLTGTNATNNQTLIVGPTTYTFVTALSGISNEVLIGATGAATLSNLVAAINAGVGAGTFYGFNTVANTQANAILTSGSLVTLTAIKGGTSGNSIVLTNGVTAFTIVGFASGGPDTNKVSQIAIAGINLLSTYVVYNQSNNQTAADVVAAVNSYQGTSGFTAIANKNVILILSVNNGTTYNNALFTVTTAGNVVTANCHFVVNAVQGQNVSIISVGAVTNLLTATITFQDSGHASETLLQFLGRVVANINANSATSGYLAWLDTVGIAIWISKAINSNIDLTANISVTSTVTISGSAFLALTAVGNLAYLTGTVPSSTFDPYIPGVMPTAVVTASGGIGPYSYNWSISNINNLSRVLNTINDPTNNSQIVNAYAVNSYVTGTGSFTLLCTITDSSSPVQTAYVTFNGVLNWIYS